jgi:hypothetical protein
MHVKIDWIEPIPLAKHRKLLLDEKELLARVERLPGIYFFSRKFGNKFEPFYIGQTISIRGRLRHHWRSDAIKQVLRGEGIETPTQIKGGERYFHCGYLGKGKGSADQKKYLRIGERYLIRQAMAFGCSLLNKSLTKKKVDTLEFAGSVKGRGIFPKKGKVEA